MTKLILNIDEYDQKIIYKYIDRVLLKPTPKKTSNKTTLPFLANFYANIP